MEEKGEYMFFVDEYGGRRRSKGLAVASLQQASFHNTPPNKFREYINGRNMCSSNVNGTLMKGRA